MIGAEHAFVPDPTTAGATCAECARLPSSPIHVAAPPTEPDLGLVDPPPFEHPRLGVAQLAESTSEEVLAEGTVGATFEVVGDDGEPEASPPVPARPAEPEGPRRTLADVIADDLAVGYVFASRTGGNPHVVGLIDDPQGARAVCTCKTMLRIETHPAGCHAMKRAREIAGLPPVENPSRGE